MKKTQHSTTWSTTVTNPTCLVVVPQFQIAKLPSPKEAEAMQILRCLGGSDGVVGLNLLISICP